MLLREQSLHFLDASRPFPFGLRTLESVILVAMEYMLSGRDCSERSYSIQYFRCTGIFQTAWPRGPAEAEPLLKRMIRTRYSPARLAKSRAWILFRRNESTYFSTASPGLCFRGALPKGKGEGATGKRKGKDDGGKGDRRGKEKGKFHGSGPRRISVKRFKRKPRYFRPVFIIKLPRRPPELSGSPTTGRMPIRYPHICQAVDVGTRNRYPHMPM